MTNPPGAMPPLPERDGWAPAMKSDVYMPAKMHDYAKAYAAPLIARVAELQAESEKLHAQLDELLAHCSDGECHVCSRVICPSKDGMHFHHDGCPSCAALTPTKD